MPIKREIFDGGLWVPIRGGGDPIAPPEPEFQIGYDKPTLANTGLIAARARKNYDGSFTNATAGQKIADLNISGYVSFPASNIEYENCLILGGPDPSISASNPNGTTTPYPLARPWTNNVVGSKLTRCELAPSHPSVGVYGVHGFDITVTRTLIRGCTDSIVAHKRNVAIKGSILTDARWYAVDPRQTDGSHDDLVQMEGGTDMVFEGTVFDCGDGPNGNPRGGNFGILGTQNAYLVNRLSIIRNWFDGGYTHIQLEEKGKGAMQNVSVIGNRHGHRHATGRAARFSAATYDAMVAAGTVRDNVYEDGVGTPWYERATALA